ncbi:alpha/beta hydrolase, partial [Alphaproteobacteria bacterium]|nr:alpha/beta hydrolase [Alphaproteobacteria bacterium]
MKAQNGGQQDLLHAGERIDQAPQWFQDALANKPQDKFVAYEQTKLHYRQWHGPNADAPNLVLVHGGGAHARWYDFIAPLLTDYYNVIAVDLPGMGDSGWLKDYKREIMAEALITMVRDAGFTGKPAIIGHSMGGMVSLITGHLYHSELAAVMICDYYVRPPHAHEEWYMEEDESGVMRPRQTRET